MYNGEKYLINALNGLRLTVQNNLLIGARKREQPDNHAFDEMGSLRMYTGFDINNDEILVTGNIAQGSEGYNYVVPHVSCADAVLQTSY